MKSYAEDRDGNVSLPEEATIDLPGPPLTGDVDGNGVVDVFDLVLVASQFGQSGAGLRGDVTGDGKVDVFDIVAVASHFGEHTVAAAPSPLSKAEKGEGPGVRSEPIRQAIRALEAIPDKPDGAEIAVILREMLRFVQDDSDFIPAHTRLLLNYPNPFNPETWIPYNLATDAQVVMTIYDVRGKVVRRLELGYRPAGSYQERDRAAYWDGRDEHGERVANGSYIGFSPPDPQEFVAWGNDSIRQR